MAKEKKPEPVKEAAPVEAPKEEKKPEAPTPKTDEPKEKKPAAPAQKPQEKPKEKKPEHSKDFKYIVRVSNTDLDGHKSISNSLRKISGVSFMFANAICQVAGVERTAITGELNDADIKKIQSVVENPSEAGFPTWMLNRRKDYETGNDKHLIINDLKFTKDNDLKRLKKIKSYRGMRHQAGLPSRGQRTKSNFRTNKGKKR